MVVAVLCHKVVVGDQAGSAIRASYDLDLTDDQDMRNDLLKYMSLKSDSISSRSTQLSSKRISKRPQSSGKNKY